MCIHTHFPFEGDVDVRQVGEGVAGWCSVCVCVCSMQGDSSGLWWDSGGVSCSGRVIQFETLTCFDGGEMRTS